MIFTIVSTEDSMVGKRIVFLHLGVQFPILSQLCKKLGGKMPIPKNKEDFDQVFRPGDKEKNFNN